MMGRLIFALSVCLSIWSVTAQADSLCIALHDAEAVAAFSGAKSVPADLAQRLRSAPSGGRQLSREVDALAHAIDRFSAIGGDAALLSMRMSLERLRGAWPQCFLAMEELAYEGASKRLTIAESATPDVTAQSMQVSRGNLSRVTAKSLQWASIELGLIILCLALLVVVVRRQPSKRRSKRYLCNVPARIRGLSVWDGSLVNVSSGGAQLRVSGHEIKVGDSVEILCDQLNTSAKVRWVNIHFVGVQFAKKITENDARALAKI